MFYNQFANPKNPLTFAPPKDTVILIFNMCRI
jgi:hypothetical protein